MDNSTVCLHRASKSNLVGAVLSTRGSDHDFDLTGLHIISLSLGHVNVLSKCLVDTGSQALNHFPYQRRPDPGRFELGTVFCRYRNCASCLPLHRWRGDEF